MRADGQAGFGLVVRSASKTFGPTKVLDGVDLDVPPGEIHGLVGTNGSGKSTLVKLLSGYHDADEGSAFYMGGERFGPPVRVSELQRLGVTFVHQDLGLVDDMSVVDNVLVGRHRCGRFTRMIERAAERQAALVTFKRLGLRVDPDAAVSRLTTAERVAVAIARALQGCVPRQGCIVVDEATEAMPREVLREFYATLRALARGGTGILIVSHRLPEIMALTERVTVLYDGRVVAGGVRTAATSEGELMRLMLGGRASTAARRVGVVDGGKGSGLEARHIVGRRVADVSFSVGSGEILGVTGVPGSGYEELPYLLTGVERGRGVIRVESVSLHLGQTPIRKFIGAGIVLVPERRAGRSLALELTVTDNLTVPWIRQRCPRLWVTRGWQLEEFARVVGEFDLRPARPDLLAGQVSGGNQQKLSLAKWLMGSPRVVVVHEPTQGVDATSREAMFVALGEAARGGAAIVVCTIEAGDLASMCDRVLVIRNGLINRELEKPLTEERIIEAVYETTSELSG